MNHMGTSGSRAACVGCALRAFLFSLADGLSHVSSMRPRACGAADAYPDRAAMIRGPRAPLARAAPRRCTQRRAAWSAFSLYVYTYIPCGNIYSQAHFIYIYIYIFLKTIAETKNNNFFSGARSCTACTIECMGMACMICRLNSLARSSSLSSSLVSL